MRFTDAHSSSGVCSPTRYSLLTGRYHWRTRLQQGIVGVWEPPLIAADRLTIAGLAKQHGYHTACVGKWHLGWDWPIAADEMKHFRGLGGQAGGGGKVVTEATPEQVAAWKDVFAQRDPRRADDPRVRRVLRHRRAELAAVLLHRERPHRRRPVHPAAGRGLRRRTRRACKARRSRAGSWTRSCRRSRTGRAGSSRSRPKAGKPFLLYLPLTAPHTPIAVAKDWQGKSDLKHPYADFVMQTDATVGRVLDALKTAGVADDTLVVFTSDNGCSRSSAPQQLEAKGHFPSGPLRGYKADAWEGGHRVPFVVRWPGVVKPGTTCGQTVCSVDLMATLADVLGAKLPATAGEDSVSLVPLLRGEDRPVHEAVVHQSSTGVFAIRSGKWKLILGPGSGPPDGTKPHLYDLDADLGETNDLAADHPDEVKRLTACWRSSSPTGGAPRARGRRTTWRSRSTRGPQAGNPPPLRKAVRRPGKIRSPRRRA